MSSASRIFPIKCNEKAQPTTALTVFVTCAQLMLDPSTPESLRRQAEKRLLAQLPVVKALGVFDLFAVRDPALATMLRDDLEQLGHDDACVAPQHMGGQLPAA